MRAFTERGFGRTVHLLCTTRKEQGIFVSCFLSYALRSFGIVVVFARAFVERGFCRTVCWSTHRLGVRNEMQFYESYDSNEFTRSNGYKMKTEDLRPKNEDPVKIILKSLEKGLNMILN